MLSLYKAVDEDSFDEVEKKVIEVVDSTTSSMVVKATREDISGFQYYSIHTLNETLSISSDIEQFKLMSVVNMKGQVLGHVSHHFIKEYQARGAPHFHMVL